MGLPCHGSLTSTPRPWWAGSWYASLHTHHIGTHVLHFECSRVPSALRSNASWLQSGGRRPRSCGRANASCPCGHTWSASAWDGSCELSSSLFPNCVCTCDSDNPTMRRGSDIEVGCHPCSNRSSRVRVRAPFFSTPLGVLDVDVGSRQAAGLHRTETSHLRGEGVFSDLPIHTDKMCTEFYAMGFGRGRHRAWLHKQRCSNLSCHCIRELQETVTEITRADTPKIFLVKVRYVSGFTAEPLGSPTNLEGM
jgi:hypothetical protein